MKVLSRRYVPIPVAKRILDEVLPYVQENPLVQRTYEYLMRFAKCDAEAAERAVRRLIEELGLSELTAVNLVNIVPESVHEARAILEVEGRVVEPEKVEKAVSIVKQECG